MQGEDATIYIVDDDSSVRVALSRLLRSVGLRSETFDSAQAFLASDQRDEPGCLVSDIRMPGLSGLDLQEKMQATGRAMPIIFITGHGSVSMTVRAMKAGAVDFLEKPFDDQLLLDTIQMALERSKHDRQVEAELAELRQRYATLTPRECEVFALVVTGMLNKQVAGELGASEKTIKVHRARVMQKMKVVSLAELVRLAGKLGITPPKV